MTTCELTLTFEDLNLDEENHFVNNIIENQRLHNIRREIANSFRNSEFGNIIEVDENKFENAYLRPTSDFYNEESNSFRQTYLIHLPLNNGNLGYFLQQELPILFSNLREFYNVEGCARVYMYPDR